MAPGVLYGLGGSTVHTGTGEQVGALATTITLGPLRRRRRTRFKLQRDFSCQLLFLAHRV